uniref:Innexin n=1 Tax=Schistocephalus solidus TaxID=70667 RepID=A0A0X3PXF2_SCHSO
MIGSEFLDYASKLHVATYVGVEDFADKFNFLITVMVLLLCATVVTVKQYMLKPISCYIATEVGGRNLLDYVENYCWVQGTIPISYAGNVPENDEQWAKLESQKLLYYQWVPFVLGLQCILFYIPRIIWQMICYNRTGTDLQHLINLASEAAHATSDKRAETVKHLAKSLEQLLFQHREYRTGWATKVRKVCYKVCRLFYISKRLGTHLFGTYLFIKLLYLANSVGQLYLMQNFLGLNSSQYTYLGAAIATNILTGRDWQVTLVFPRVGFCVVPIRHLVGPVYATAQCALPMNMLNERIYMFLWFWVLLSAFLTAISIPMWFMRMAYEKSRTNFVRRFLRVGYDEENRYSSKDRCMVAKFTRQFLRHDGIFLLRMVAINAGELIAAEIVHKLWEIYKQKYYNRDFNVPDANEEENDSAWGGGGDSDAVRHHGPNGSAIVLMERGNALTQRPSPPSAPSHSPGLYKGKASVEDAENEEQSLRKQYL